MSWTEIAVDMAKLVAAQQGCALESFSLDGVEIEEEDGVEVILLQASVCLTPLPDEIPWQLPDAVKEPHDDRDTADTAAH